MKKFIILAISLILCFSLSSCDSIIEPIDYVQNGIQITLDTSYKRSNVQKYTACYRSSVATVYLLREAFGDALTDTVSLAEYAAMVQNANGLTEEISEHQNYLSFEYETVADGIRLMSLVAVYKMSDCFWTVQFVCDSSYYETLCDSFESFASSVKDVKVTTDPKG